MEEVKPLVMVKNVELKDESNIMSISFENWGISEIRRKRQNQRLPENFSATILSIHLKFLGKKSRQQSRSLNIKGNHYLKCFFLFYLEY